MANDLNDVVRVVIFDQTQAVSTASFQIPLILATHLRYPERTRIYNNLQAVGEDFEPTAAAYLIAQKLFGQAGVLGATPPSIVIGRRQVNSITVSPVVANNTKYTVTVNGADYSFTSGAAATDSEITTGLDTALNGVVGITATGGAATLTVAVDPAGGGWTFSTSPNLEVGPLVNAATIVEDLEAVEQENATWYCVVSDTQDGVEQEALSDAIQGREKIYGLSTSNVDAATTSTSDIGARLSAKSAARTFGVYLPTAETEYPEAAWVGSQLAVTPGQNDWNFKRANGVTVSSLTATQINNLKNKNYNYYTRKGGVNIFQNGDMFNGAPIDVQVGKDWLTARLQESIYFRLVNMLKVPMTDAGLLIVENEIRSVLAQAQANTLVDGGWTVATPPVDSIPENLRAQRAAGVFVIRARLAGAVRFAEVNIFLSV